MLKLTVTTGTRLPRELFKGGMKQSRRRNASLFVGDRDRETFAD